MSTVRISGVIVPSEYDMEWFADLIDRGVMTPQSRVQSALERADKSEPLELYINSPGGSVFSANEILNMCRDWEKETEQSITVTVGALAASAAGMLATALGPVRAHANSRFMFHSAASFQVGGPGAMEDIAGLLHSINDEQTRRLVDDYGFDADVVNEWFSEGRMGWIDAKAALEHGIAAEIVDAPAEPLQLTDDDVAEYNRHGLAGIAALVAGDEDPGPGSEQELPPDRTVTQAHVDMAYEEGYAAGEAAGAAHEKKTLAAEIETLSRKLTVAEHTIAEQETALKAAKLKCARLDRGLRDEGTGDQEPSAGATGDEYWRRVDELVADGVSKNSAMLRVQREHPDAFAEMLANAKRNHAGE